MDFKMEMIIYFITLSIVTISMSSAIKSTTATQSALPQTINYQCNTTPDKSKTNLTINDVGNLTLKILNQDQIKKLTSGTSVVLSNVPTDTQFKIEISKPSNGITVHANLFTLQCKLVKAPYSTSVTANEGQKDGAAAAIPTQKALYVVPTKDYIKFTMNFGQENGPYVIGDSLNLTIAIVDSHTNVKYRVLDCIAQDLPAQKQKYELSKKDGCPTVQANSDGVFAGEWSDKGNSKSHSIVAFRFTGSNKIILTCNVRVCTDPKETSDCDAKTCSSRKRRDIHDMKKGNKLMHTSVKTEFDVYDTIQDVSGSTKNTQTIYSMWMVLWCSFWTVLKLYF